MILALYDINPTPVRLLTFSSKGIGRGEGCLGRSRGSARPPCWQERLVRLMLWHDDVWKDKERTRGKGEEVGNGMRVGRGAPQPTRRRSIYRTL